MFLACSHTKNTRKSARRTWFRDSYPSNMKNDDFEIWNMTFEILTSLITIAGFLGLLTPPLYLAEEGGGAGNRRHGCLLLPPAPPLLR